jgi:hypothetical protein
VEGMRDARVKRLLWVLERSRDTSPATPATPASRLQDGIPERGGWKGQPPQTPAQPPQSPATPAQPPRVLNGSRTAFAGDAGDAGDDSPLLSKPGDGGTWDGVGEVNVEVVGRAGLEPATTGL